MIAEMVTGIAKAAESAIQAQDGDFVSEGLLYCGNCKTPKETIIGFPWGQTKVRCLCKCKSDLYKAEREAQRRKDLELFRDNLRSLFPDRSMRDWNFSNDDRKNEKLSRMCREYCKNFPRMLELGKGLLFFGTVGTGKTFYATCIANELIDQGYRCYVTNFTRLCNRLFSLPDKQYAIDNLNTYQLLVIDDLAAERNTEYMNEIVWNVIDTRYRAKLPLIITTNLSSAELKETEISRARVYSRLYEMCHFIEVNGNDRRIGKMKADYKEMQELLGG